MAKSLPFPAIKASASIEQIANLTGIKWIRENTTLRAKCPVCGGHDRSLTVTPNKADDKGDAGVFFCSVAKVGGDRVALYAHVKGIKQFAAHLEVAKAFAPHLIDGEQEPTVPTVPEERLRPEKKEDQQEGRRGFAPPDYLLYDAEAVRAMGIQPEIAKALGIAFWPRGLHKGRVAFCLRTEDGTSAGWVSVAVELVQEVRLPPTWKL